MIRRMRHALFTSCLSIAALAFGLGGLAAADATTDRAKKTADRAIAYLLKLAAAADGADCKAVVAKLEQFATDNAAERDALSAEFAAGEKDKAYGDALAAEGKKAQQKLKGLKRPPCVSNDDVRAAMNKARVKGM